MFPHPCGEEFEKLVASGADPRTVVPDEYVVVRGGTKPLPPLGVEFSCASGPDLESAACAVPYNQIRIATAGAIRLLGGTVEWKAEYSQRRTLNKQHVHVVESGEGAFGELQPNPVPKGERIDG
jgi:hypothetical protein